MRKYFLPAVLCFAILLSGCSFKTARYDNIEYASFVKLLTMTEKAANYCHNPNAIGQYLSLMSSETAFLENYTEYRLNNPETYAIVNNIIENVDQMIVRYNNDGGNVSIGYCKAKILILTKGIESAVKVTAKRPLQ